ncbi:MAG: HTH domain-containing protein [Syntrophomonadaceae bacterium]|nr:HTH domain-containing protein [Syntrophomonadaceae bacterium]
MEKMVLILERIAPEILHIVKLRYQILREVLHHQPVGRRQIAQRVGCSERTARTEIESLREKGALETTVSGIRLTAYGRELIEETDEVITYLENLNLLSQQLKNEFSLDDVLVVPGDSSTDIYAKKDLGRAAARYLKNCLYDGCRVAVTGGTTLAELARAITGGVQARGVTVLPSRGGLGGDVDEQANVVAARIAKAIGAEYRLFHVPDNLEEGLIASLRKDTKINEMVQLIKSCNILVHGIGCALEMATRRGLSPESCRLLEEKGAVGEAIRHYFNAKGEIVFCHPGIGLEFADLERIDKVIAVAGGSSKAEAIAAVLRNRKRGVLITDEAAARRILGKGDRDG